MVFVSSLWTCEAPIALVWDRIASFCLYEVEIIDTRLLAASTMSMEWWAKNWRSWVRKWVSRAIFQKFSFFDVLHDSKTGDDLFHELKKKHTNWLWLKFEVKQQLFDLFCSHFSWDSWRQTTSETVGKFSEKKRQKRRGKTFQLTWFWFFRFLSFGSTSFELFQVLLSMRFTKLSLTKFRKVLSII